MNRIKTLTEQAVKYLDSGCFETCIELLNLNLSSLDASVDLVAYRGDAYAGTGQHELAIRDFDRAISMSPDNCNYFLSRGASLDATGKHKKARADLYRVIDDSPCNESAHLLLCLSFLHPGVQDISKAQTHAERVRKACPSHPILHFVTGAIAFFTEDYETAVRSLNDAVREIPNDDSAWSYLAMAYQRLAPPNLNLAILAYEHAVNIAPSYVNYKISLAKVLFENKEERRANEVLGKALTSSLTTGQREGINDLLHRNLAWSEISDEESGR